MITTEMTKKRRDGDPECKHGHHLLFLSHLLQSVHLLQFFNQNICPRSHRLQQLSNENILINADMKQQALFHALAMAPNISDRSGFWAGRSLTKKECCEEVYGTVRLFFSTTNEAPSCCFLLLLLLLPSSLRYIGSV